MGGIQMQFGESPQRNITDWLKEHGIDAYLPGQHVGSCKSRYVVVRPAGVSRPLAGYTSTTSTYELLCYVPKNEGSQLEDYVWQVKRIMAGLKEHMSVRDAYRDGPHFPDEDIDAHMMYVTYTAWRKLQEGV